MTQNLRKLLPLNPSKYNLIRHVSCCSKPLEVYRVRLAHPCDYSRVLCFMLETYFRSEPSLVNIGGGLAGRPSPTLVQLMHQNIREGLTLLAEDRNERLVGAAVNVDSRRHDIARNSQLAECCECPLARDYIEFFQFCSRQADLHTLYCLENVFECAHLAVHPDHQARGIAKRLVQESWIMARDTAYRLFRIDCTSRYTGKIAESFGWRCVYSIPYRRYFHDGKFVFQCIEEPHTELKIYVDTLNYYQDYYPLAKKQKR